MQRGKVRLGFLGVLNTEPLFYNRLQNDWESEAAYFVGKSVLE